MQTFRFLVLYSLLLLTTREVGAQRYPFYQLNVEDGLVQSQPRAMVQDSLGHLWIGTLGGLSRYDGRHFVNYTAKDGLQGNVVRALALDTSGNLWVGGTDGVCRFDGKTFQKIDLFPSGQKEKNSVRQIMVDSRGVVWLLVSGKLYFMQNDSARLVSLPFQSTYITAFLPSNNSLWLAAANGKAYQYQHNLWDSIALPMHQNRSALIQQIYQDRQGRVWLAGTQGLLLWQKDQLHSVLPTADSALFPVYAISEDKRGNLWLGCAKGVISLQKSGGVIYYGKKNGLSNNSFYNLYTDRAGNVWMASDGQGVYRFSGAPFTIVDETTGLGSGQVMSLAEGRDGEVFVGTYDAGLFRFKEGLAQAVKLPVKNIPAITTLNYHEGTLWLGTRSEGLWRWDGQRLQTFRRQKDGLPSDYIIALYRDSLQQLWLGTAAGVVCLKQDGFHTLPDIHSDVQAFLQWSSDSLLMSGTEGLWLYEKKRVSPFKTNSPLDSLPPQAMVRTGDLLWAGTSENGIVLYNMRRRTSFTLNSENILRSDFIYNLLVDRKGSVWIGTGMGIHCISGYQTENPQVSIYGSGQGIAGMESNHHAAMQTSNGTVWMGTTGGAMLLTMEQPVPLAQNTSLVLQSVSLPGLPGIPEDYYDSLSSWYRVPQHMKLPYRQNTISFAFQALALVQQKQVRYRHRLLGLDTAWSPWVAENTITYSALPPGQYTLEVQSGIEGNRARISTISYAFAIHTPFHKSILFRVLLVVFLILTGIGIQYVLSRRRRRFHEMIRALRAEEQNRVRQRTAEDFHDEVGNRITRITVLTQVLKGKLQPMTEETERLLGKIQENAGLLYNGTRDILWALKPENDNVYELLQRLDELGTELFGDTVTSFNFTGAHTNWRQYKLPMDVTRNLMMIGKEAMSNCLKYAGGSRVQMAADVSEKGILTLEIKDNGKGFTPEDNGRGQGLNNMKRRATRIGGTLVVTSSKEKGTRIQLSVPLLAFADRESWKKANDASLFASLKSGKQQKKEATHEHPGKPY